MGTSTPTHPAATITWSGSLTATSSIAHGGETRGTTTLLRRELIRAPEGRLVYVPVVSGNTLRGRLRRVGEELLRDVVGYEGKLSPAAAHALRGGGSLAKTGHEPLSGNRLQTLRELVPQIGVFGAAGGGTIISGCLDVGKVVPHLVETAHITGVETEQSAFTATQLEDYTRQDDATGHDFAGVVEPDDDGLLDRSLQFDETGLPLPIVQASTTSQMRYRIETFPAGTAFHTWLRLRRPTDLELSFFVDVLHSFRVDGRLGGRVGIGHGMVRPDLQSSVDLPELVDWRATLVEHRDQVLEALGWLS